MVERIKKYLWNRKYKHKIVRCIHTTHLLKTLARLQLWGPTAKEDFALTATINLNQTLGSMAEALEKVMYKSDIVK